ncbi:MAG: DUF3570 domain-containing protein [Pseudomonadota bacterium]
MAQLQRGLNVMLHRQRIALACLALLYLSAPRAAVLPEDRADILYHSYDGGGVTIAGPSVLARKQIGSSASVQANYYVDSVTSASIDVVTTASSYTEERTEQSIGLDYLFDKTTLSGGYTNSEESDFSANTAYFSITQDFFGDLSTLTIGYARGWDDVSRLDTEVGEIDRQNLRVGLSQIINKNWIVSGNLETITDEGFLNNPYRQVRYVDTTVPRGYSFESEVYPRTRTSTAVSVTSLYYLQHRAAVRNIYRYFTDDWNITAHTFELGYIHPLEGGWTFDFRWRHYRQDKAEFYSDLYPFQQAQNFLARDKELSTFTSNTLGAGFSLDMQEAGINFVERGTLNAYVDYIVFDYDDFRDLRGSVNATSPALVGNESLYSLDAVVLRLFFSVWF